MTILIWNACPITDSIKSDIEKKQGTFYPEGAFLIIEKYYGNLFSRYRTSYNRHDRLKRLCGRTHSRTEWTYRTYLFLPCWDRGVR